MATYTIYFLDARKVIVSFDLIECADDDEAWSHAPRLLKVRTDSRNIEIHQDDRVVPPPASFSAALGKSADFEGAIASV